MQMLRLLVLMMLLCPAVSLAQSIDYYDLLVHNNRTVVSDGSNVPVDRANTVVFEVNVTGTAEVLFRISGPGRFAWQSLSCTASDSTTPVTSTTASGLYTCNVAGGEAVSARLDTCTACTVSVSIRRSTAILGNGGAGGGGVTGWPSSSGIKEVTWADSLANALRIGDGVTPMCIYTDATLGPRIRPCTASDVRLYVLPNFNLVIYDEEGTTDILTFDPDAATPKDKYLFGSTHRPLKSFWIGAGAMEGDGTNCPSNSSAVTINSGPKLQSFICADRSSSILYGSLRMPDDWDGGTLTFQHVYVQTAADTSALNGDISAQCRGNGEALSSTWGTAVAIDDAAVTGSNQNDMTTSGAVTPAGTCAAGDMLYFRYVLDATGTTTATATLHHLGFYGKYSSTSLSH